jgi:glycosyltransferase involved in cell wall biosynthesis
MYYNPLVSILVTPYNQEAYIGKALDSLLMQDCSFEYEILVGEDCSSDRTREICVEYSQKYPEKIRLFLNDHNKGLINNYFDLLEKARGKYLADCGGDDYWLTRDKLSRQIDILEKHPEVGMVYGNWQMLFQKDGSLETNKAGRSEDWFDSGHYGYEAVIDYINNQDHFRIVLSTACFRKDWLMEVIKKRPELFRGKDVVCEDLPIILSLLLKGPLYQMKEELMVYRVLEKSVSHSVNPDDYIRSFAYKAFVQTIELAYSLGIKIKTIKPYIDSKLPDFIYQAFLMGDKFWMKSIAEKMKSFDIKLNFKQMIMYVCTQNSFFNALSAGVYRKLNS